MSKPRCRAELSPAERAARAAQPIPAPKPKRSRAQYAALADTLMQPRPGPKLSPAQHARLADGLMHAD